MGKKDKEPKPDKEQPENARFYLEFEGERLYITPENAFAYIHKAEPWYDHIFVCLPPDASGQELGAYIWRLKQKNFDEMLEDLTEHGMEHYVGSTVSDMDLRAFEEAGLEKPIIKEPHRYDLTPRQENLARFMAYILMTEQLNAQEFEGSGDLHI
jgi:hypothetical protein